MDAEGFIGFAYSQGALRDVLKKNIPTVNEEISRFTDIVKKRIGDRVLDAIYSYRMRLGIK
ncbi:hypothetical protein [Brassicibacter mesophilus]|uniref:hypothetical protein n=1 Tax=Brassicibacter mesophilus TaxID=745119 RepID=UPI003D20DCED